GLAAQTTFVVQSSNNAPTISTVSNQSTTGTNASSAIPFTVGDSGTPAGSLLVSATSSNPALFPVSNLAIGGGGANRTLTITPASNSSGSSTITLTVTDGDMVMLSGASWTTTSTTVTVSSTAGLLPGMVITGNTNIPTGDIVVSVGTGSF